VLESATHEGEESLVFNSHEQRVALKNSLVDVQVNRRLALLRQSFYERAYTKGKSIGAFGSILEVNSDFLI